MDWTGLESSGLGIVPASLAWVWPGWSPLESTGIHLDYMGEGKDLEFPHYNIWQILIHHHIRRILIVYEEQEDGRKKQEDDDGGQEQGKEDGEGGEGEEGEEEEQELEEASQLQSQDEDMDTLGLKNLLRKRMRGAIDFDDSDGSSQKSDESKEEEKKRRSKKPRVMSLSPPPSNQLHLKRKLKY